MIAEKCNCSLFAIYLFSHHFIALLSFMKMVDGDVCNHWCKLLNFFIFRNSILYINPTVLLSNLFLFIFLFQLKYHMICIVIVFCNFYHSIHLYLFYMHTYFPKLI